MRARVAGSTGRGAAVAGAVLALAAVVSGCTAGVSEPVEPSPSPTASTPDVVQDDRDRVAIVVGPSSHVSPAEAAALETAARVLAADPPQDVGEVRVVKAESAAFAGDLAELFSDQGYDLVCIVGTGAAPLLVDAARANRATRFCGTDAAVEGGPENIVAVAVDPVAVTTVAAAAAGPTRPPVGLVAGPEVGGLDVVEPLLRSLLPTPEVAPAAPTAPSPRPVQTVVAASTADGSVPAAVAAVEQAAPEAAILLAPLTAGAVATFASGGTRSIVVDDWVATPGEQLPEGVLLALTVDRDAQLRAAVAAGRDPTSAQVEVLRLADGVLGAEPGSGPAATPALRRARAVIEDANEG